jgi:MSHA biogenesis protein MshQ
MKLTVRHICRILAGFPLILTLALMAPLAHAICSSDYKGLATINEVRQLSQGQNNERFIEIKLLSSSLDTADYANWTLSACSSGGCTGQISVGAMDSGNLPWLVADRSLITSEDYLNFDGMDIILRDADGRTIDYLSVEGYRSQYASSCTPAFDWEAPASNTKDLFRSPDGTGDWDFKPGESGTTTEADTNDSDVAGPTISITSTTVFQGETASFVVTLDSAAGRDLLIDYQTRDSTATQGTGYVSRAGTLTIPAGQTQASVGVPTLQSGSLEQRQFFLQLSSARDASNGRFGLFESQIGVGTILPAPVADWHLDDGPWDGSFGEVLDSAGSGLHGRTLRGVDFSRQNPALTGDPGTCGYADFEESQYQYIAVPDDGRLDLSEELTISAWINPESIPLLVTDTILSKDENYLLQVDWSGEIRWEWENQRGERFRLRTSGANISLGTWNHVAIVFENGRQSIYVNGLEKATSQETGLLASNNDPLYFGVDHRSWIGEYFDGLIDEVVVFRSAFGSPGINAVYQRRRPCSVSQLRAFEVTVPAYASVCGAADISVRALDGRGNLLDSYEGQISLTTSSGSGNWRAGASDVPQGNLNPNPDTDNDGTVSYQFQSADNGTVSLRLANASADELTVLATDLSDGQQGRSGPVQFLENAFVIESADTNALDIVAERDHDFVVRAVRRDDATGECGIVPDYDGAIGLKAWLSRTSDDPGGAAPEVNGGAGVLVPGNTQPASDNLTLNFTEGTAAFVLGTSDVGQYRLNLLDDTSGVVVDAAGNPLPVAGTGDRWTVRPDRFSLAVTGNPGASTASGDRFRAAGEPFELVLSALGAAGNPLLSFGQEGSPQGGELSHSLLQPVGGEVGVLSGTLQVPGSSFNAGRATISNLSWNEVGILELSAANPAYLGVAPGFGGTSGAVGRFIPDRFELTVAPGELAAFCATGAPFVYAGQPTGWAVAPELMIAAMGPGSYVTRNYTRGGFMKLTPLSVSRSGPTTDNSTVDATGGNYPVTAALQAGLVSSAGPGLVSYAFSMDDRITYDKTVASRIAPFGPDLSVTVDAVQDSDGVVAPATPASVNPAAPLELRYGRWALDNAYGPENVTALSMPFRAELWNGSRFVVNVADSCSSWSTASVADPEVHHTLVPSAGTLAAGEGGPLTLDPNGTRGTDTLLWDVPLWLEADFDGDGSLDDPTGLATFGVYRGHDRVIYWQER